MFRQGGHGSFARKAHFDDGSNVGLGWGYVVQKVLRDGLKIAIAVGKNVVGCSSAASTVVCGRIGGISMCRRKIDSWDRRLVGHAQKVSKKASSEVLDRDGEPEGRHADALSPVEDSNEGSQNAGYRR